MPYGIGETVVLTTYGRHAIGDSPNSEHLMQRHEIQGLEIRAVRETDGRREIAFKWIREFHPAWAFAGVECECETMSISNEDGILTATDAHGTTKDGPLAIVGLTERASDAGLDLSGTGRLSFVRVEGGILIDDFTPRSETTDRQLERHELDWNWQVRTANGTHDPEMVLLAVIHPATSLKSLVDTRCAELRWEHPSHIMWMSRKFGFDEGTLIARTTYANLVDRVAGIRREAGAVVDVDLVILPSFDSIEWDNPAGDDRLTLPQGAAMRRRPYADDARDGLAA